MASNQQYSITKRGDGTSIKRADGRFTYANRLSPITFGSGSQATVIFMWDRLNNVLYAVPIGGGTPVIVIASFYPSNFKCDYVAQVLYWSNDASGSGTYPGVNAIYSVPYTAGTGAFTATPQLIRASSGSEIGALWPDNTNAQLYFSEGNAIKRGTLALAYIELMAVPTANAQDFWKGTTNYLYIADDGIGSIDRLGTVVSGTPPQYQETDEYYMNSEDYDFIDCDQANDHMFISGDGIFPIRVMTLTNPVDMTTFHTKSNVLYEPFAIDAVNGHMYISEYTANKMYRYEYGTRSKVNQTEILDYTALSLTSGWGRIALG